MGGYSEGILRKIGKNRRKFISFILKMNWLGYFLFTINPNSKLYKITNNMRYTIIANTYVYLELAMIYLYVKVYTFKVIQI
jgi:hypothetical protein